MWRRERASREVIWLAASHDVWDLSRIADLGKGRSAIEYKGTELPTVFVRKSKRGERVSDVVLTRRPAPRPLVPFLPVLLSPIYRTTHQHRSERRRERKTHLTALQ